MRRAVSFVLIFAVGFLISSFIFKTHSSKPNSTDQSLAQAQSAQAKDGRAALATPAVAPKTVAKPAVKTTPTPLIPAERIETLTNALSFSEERPLLRQHLISRLPNYEAAIRPELEKAGIELLAKKIMKSSDGDAKADAQVAEFLSSMKDLNPPLGQFYAVSAGVLRELKSANSKKQAFNMDSTLLSVGTQVGADAETLQRFTAQPAVLALFDEYQQHSLKERIKAVGPENLDGITELLATLPAGSELSFVDEYEYLLVALTFSATRPQREKVLAQDGILAAFEKLSGSAEIRSLLAQFYALAAVDALEAADRDHAIVWLEKSELLRPNLRSQELVKKYLTKGSFLPRKKEVEESPVVKPVMNEAAQTSQPAAQSAVESKTVETKTVETKTIETKAAPKTPEPALDFDRELKQRDAAAQAAAPAASGSPIGLGGIVALILVGVGIWYLRFVKRRSEVILNSLGNIELKEETSRWDFPTENAGPMERERRTVNE